MITIAVVEDDRGEAERLRSFLERYEKEQTLEQQAHFFSGVEDFKNSFSFQYDLLFLDIELPDGNGMDLARWIREKDTGIIIIFITHLAQYAIDGYAVSALDYVLKPIEYPSFALKLKRAYIRIRNNRQEFITVKNGANMERINTNDLQYIEIYKHHIRYVLTDSIVESYGILSKVEETLPKKGFYRCSSSFIINFRHVERMDNMNIYIGKTSIPVSRAKKKELMSEYHRYYSDLDEEQ
ncbi:MAG: response regulator transcription factor [Lachnospiraceae bacterium]|nr:response regulator transcription factor [Lachnospiraceae bacterium]